MSVSLRNLENNRNYKKLFYINFFVDLNIKKNEIYTNPKEIDII
jgi:hypothetical protein